MNVYEEAHKLEQAIRGSDEYKTYKAAKDRIEGNAELKAMIEDFEKKSVEMQKKQMTGGTLTPEMTESLQKLSAIIMKDPLAAEYLQTQMRFGIMMQDVYKILDEVAR